MKKQVVNERTGSGSWYQSFVKGEFSEDLVRSTMTNNDLNARLWELAQGNAAENQAKAKAFRDANTRIRQNHRLAYDKIIQETQEASRPSQIRAMLMVR